MCMIQWASLAQRIKLIISEINLRVSTFQIILKFCSSYSDILKKESHRILIAQLALGAQYWYKFWRTASRLNFLFPQYHPCSPQNDIQIMHVFKMFPFFWNRKTVHLPVWVWCALCWDLNIETKSNLKLWFWTRVLLGFSHSFWWSLRALGEAALQQYKVLTYGDTKNV